MFVLSSFCYEILLSAFLQNVFIDSHKFLIKFLSSNYKYFISLHYYYSRGISDARVLAVVVCLWVCLSVCVSVTCRYCIKTSERMIMQTTPRDSPGTLVFWHQESLVDDQPSSWNLRSKWPTLFRTPQFRSVPAHRASTVTAGNKGSISTNWTSTTRFPTSCM